jgi:hypothetical protein
MERQSLTSNLSSAVSRSGSLVPVAHPDLLGGLCRLVSLLIFESWRS